MRYRHVMAVLVSSVLIVLGIVFAQIQSADVTSGGEITKEKNVVASKYPGIEIHTEIEETDTYKSAVHVPLFMDDRLNVVINRYIENQKKSFHSDLNENLKVSPSPQWQSELYITFDVYQVSPSIYSFSIDTSSYLAGANGNQTTKSITMNVDTGELVELEDVLKSGVEIEKRILDDIKEYILASEEDAPYFFEESLMEISDTLYERGLLTKDSLYFKFDKYEIAAGAAGLVEVKIPLSEYEPFLEDEWRSILTLNTIDALDGDEDKGNEGIVAKEEKEEKKLSRDMKKVALTFDDGPHPQNTPAILELLKQYDMKGTFFLLGSRIEFYPDIVKTIKEQGHEIGNHTWNHKQLTSLAESDIRSEVDSVDESLEVIIGEPSTVFRPPYGATDDTIEKIVGEPSVLWTIDTLDWKNHDPQAVLSAVESDLHPNAIILLHDIHSSTVEGVKLVLEYLQSEGYTSVTVSEILSFKEE